MLMSITFILYHIGEKAICLAKYKEHLILLCKALQRITDPGIHLSRQRQSESDGFYKWRRQGGHLNPNY